MVRILFLFCILFFACKSRNPQGEKSTLSPQNTASLSKDSTRSLGIALSRPLTNKSIRFLWAEEVYDPQNRLAIRDSVRVFRLDEAFLKEMSEPERAVLAYIATFADSDNCDVSTECDGNNGIQCKIITALGLGCQCSSPHFEFLHQWFDPKASVFEDGRCYRRPMTASRRMMFSQINLTVQGTVLSVGYEGSGMTPNERWDFKGMEVFQFQEHRLRVLDSKQTTFNSKKYED
jgi:hypothetical protein